jgi:hypothetical protein
VQQYGAAAWGRGSVDAGAGAAQDTCRDTCGCVFLQAWKQRFVRPVLPHVAANCMHVSAACSDPCAAVSSTAACSEGKAAHIPFRDSKLTRLLQGSLTGAPAWWPAEPHRSCVCLAVLADPERHQLWPVQDNRQCADGMRGASALVLTACLTPLLHSSGMT